MLMRGQVEPPPPCNAISLADVEDLRANRSSEARAAFASKFAHQYDHLVAGATRPLANAILELLVRDLEQKVRQTLAESVAVSAKLPPAIASRLARDEIDVARPVLERSPVLSDDELGEIVRTHAMQYALAVAGRSQLSEQLGEALASTGEPEVVARLVGNVGAQLSKRTLKQIIHDYREERRVQDPLIRRPALPYELVDELVGVIGERLEWELVRERRMGAEEAHQLLAAIRDQATLQIVTRSHGEDSREPDLKRKHDAGELGSEEVLGFLRDGQIGRVEAALALLADTEILRVRQLLYGLDKRGMAALCARAGFATPHYVVLRMTLDLAERGVDGSRNGDGEGYGIETVHFVQNQYEGMLADPAAVDEWFAD